MGHLVQPPCKSRVTYSRLHRTLSRQVLNISREGDSTTSLGSLFQCSVTLRVKKFFLKKTMTLFQLRQSPDFRALELLDSYFIEVTKSITRFISVQLQDAPHPTQAAWQTPALTSAVGSLAVSADIRSKHF